MGRQHSLKTPFLFTIITAALLASTSLVYAIDPNASVALQNANQQAAADAQNMQDRITRMEDQIARMNEELIALREQRIQDQRELQAKDLR
jgi:TolA-binding protein